MPQSRSLLTTFQQDLGLLDEQVQTLSYFLLYRRNASYGCV